jgi:DNA-binding response OmpR family regulator
MNRHVLIVDNEPLLAEITSFRLEMLGFAPCTLTSGEAALARLAVDPPGLLIVGNVLADMDGLELLNRVSNDVKMGNIPALFMSSHADLDDVQKAFNAGADEYLVIPFDPLVLEKKIERLQHMHAAH